MSMTQLLEGVLKFVVKVAEEAEKQQVRQDRGDRVYVIQELGSNVVKIGVSCNVSERLKTLQTGNPRRLQIIHVVQGSYDLEAKLHRQLAGCRIRQDGEWFRLSDNLMNNLKDFM